MEKFLTTTLLILVIGCVLYFIIGFIYEKRNPYKSDLANGVVLARFSRLFLGFMMFLLLIWINILVIMFTVGRNETVTIPISSFLVAMGVLMLVLILYFYRVYVSVEGNIISYRPFIGKVRNYKMSDITNIKEKYSKSNLVKLKFYSGGKKIFSVEPVFLGFKDLNEITKDISRD